MKIDRNFLEKFSRIMVDQNDVLSETDLLILFNGKLDQSFYRTYQKINNLGLLDRFCRGIYVGKNFSLIDVNQKIDESSYVSFESALARHSLIGTHSHQLIRSIIPSGRSRSYSYQNYKIEQFHINSSLFWGYEVVDGYRIATKEKAYLDCLYFYTKGLNFICDIFSDVDTNLLDNKVILKYLKMYKNQRFISFVKEIIKK